jgi:hypothetical protein
MMTWRPVSLHFIGVVALSVLVVSCGKKETEAPSKTPGSAPTSAAAPFYADMLLPKEIEDQAIKRRGAVMKIMPEEADSLLGQDASIYRLYNFTGLARAKYDVGGITVAVEIAQFPTQEDAYGFYSRRRPDGFLTERIGAESFLLDSVRYFTSGEFAVSLTVAQKDSSGFSAQKLLGQEINSRISGTLSPPSTFMLFPMASKIAPSGKYYSRRFLDIDGLDKVYTTSYLTEGDTAVLFLTRDESGEKFFFLKEYAKSLGTTFPTPKAFAFDNGYSVAFVHPTRDSIVAGLVSQKLVGIIGYRLGKNERLAAVWVKGLQ